jgi:hypothetical protein
MPDHALLGLLLMGQTIISAVVVVMLSRDLRYIANIAERVRHKVESP